VGTTDGTGEGGVVVEALDFATHAVTEYPPVNADELGSGPGTVTSTATFPLLSAPEVW
jgi:hypothetical protein